MNTFDGRVKLFLSDAVPLDALSRSKIEGMLGWDDIKSVVVLADVHSKPDNPVPTGIVTLTGRTLYPFAIGQEIGCGVRLLKTSLAIDDIGSEAIDRIFQNIKSLLRDNIKKTPLVGLSDYQEILFAGYAWSKEKFALEKNSPIAGGQLHLPQDFAKSCAKKYLSFIPKDAFWGGFYRLGALGCGNHFLELQVIDKIFEPAIAKDFGIQAGRLVFMFHTGAGVFSKRTDNYYGIRYENHRWDKDIRRRFRKFLYHYDDFALHRFLARWRMFFGNTYQGISDVAPEGQRFLVTLKAAFNYSFVNRSFISKFIGEAVAKALGKEAEFELLADSAHERIDYEAFGGNYFWVHRNGASCLEYTNDSKRTILPLPGFPGGPSFLCVPSEGLLESYFSVNHGAGRVVDKSEAKKAFSQEDIFQTFKEKNIALYKLGNEDIREQAPLAFKNIDKVLETLKQHHLIKPVAATRPLAIIKG